MSDVLVGKGICKTFVEGKLQTEVLKNVDISVAPGERVAILGASGSGKSTLMHLLGGLDKPTAGEIHLDGELFSTLSANKRAQLRNQKLGFVYQFHHLLPEFSALENVAMPLMLRKISKQEALQKAAQILAQVKLDHRVKHKPSELSGGERQRVALARAMVTQPKCLLADEPTGNLDQATALVIDELMHTLNKEHGTGFLIVTHDPKLAERMDRVVSLASGSLV